MTMDTILENEEQECCLFKRLNMPTCAKFIRTIQAPKIQVDDEGKAKSFRMFSLSRPYMRSLHAAWTCFFIAFLSWFGIQPLLPTISRELGLSKLDLARSGIASVSATICVRMIVGPFCDRFGPRRVMAGLLMVGAIPMSLSGLVKNGTGLIIIRLFVGILGGAFVPCQFWTTAMFNGKVIGTANAIVGGWGNLGGGATFLFMPAIFEIVKLCGAHEFLAWKIAVVVPAAIGFSMGTIILFTTDDCPHGSWEKRHTFTQKTYSISAPEAEQGYGTNNNCHTHSDNREDEIQATKDLIKKEQREFSKKNQTPAKTGCLEHPFWNFSTTVILFIHYGLSFGIELAANNVMNLYLLYNFKRDDCVPTNGSEILVDSSFTNVTSAYNVTDSNDPSSVRPVINDFECSILSQNTASLIASLFGLMNIYARSLGGILSDIARKHMGIPGRMVVHMCCLLAVGILMITFGQMTSIPMAIFVLIFFSTFVQMAEGTTYALVPYVFPNHVGKVAGFVGAGGNTGGVLWNFIWSQLVETDPHKWFWMLGMTVILGSLLTLFICVEGVTIWHVCSSRKERKILRNRKSKRVRLAPVRS